MHLPTWLHRGPDEAATSRVLRINEPVGAKDKPLFKGNSVRGAVVASHTLNLMPHHRSHGLQVATTKYNLVTFLPKALFEQYR